MCRILSKYGEHKTKCLSFLVPLPHEEILGSRVDWTGCLGLWIFLPLRTILQVNLLRTKRAQRQANCGFAKRVSSLKVERAEQDERKFLRNKNGKDEIAGEFFIQTAAFQRRTSVCI